MSGTSASIRNADELSITAAPARCAMGANCVAVPAPALKKASSMPAKEFCSSAATEKSFPRNSKLFPAERGEASSRKSATGKSRRSITRSSSIPTAPVAPTIAT
jgi:hypothetical protein